MWKIRKKSEGFISIWGVDGLELTKMYAIKAYVKPGARTLNIVVNDGQYGKALDIQHNFLAGHKYQIVTRWGNSDGSFLEGYQREFEVGVIDMGKDYQPTEGVYREHEHTDPLVIKDYTLEVSHHDCDFEKHMVPANKPFISPEYKKIFIGLGYDL